MRNWNLPSGIVLANADAIRIPLGDERIHCVVTSPPYWGICDYDMGDVDKKSLPVWSPSWYAPMVGMRPVHVPLWRGFLGQEPTISMFVGHLVSIFREVRRVLRDDGTLWLNLGDCYINSPGNGRGGVSLDGGNPYPRLGGMDKTQGEIPEKNLAGIPWRVVLALQADGWILRSDAPWLKPNAMPNAASDRPTKGHEYMFLLSKSPRYYYDPEAVRVGRRHRRTTDWYDFEVAIEAHLAYVQHLRDVRDSGGLLIEVDAGEPLAFNVNSKGYNGDHPATFPLELVYPCILAGTSNRGVCPVCGAPWTRETERKFVHQQDCSREATRRVQKPSAIQTGWAGSLRGTTHVTTTGWRPTCAHDAEPVPAVVLDPFCGSGTTGEQCRYLLRRFVGLDLSLPYLQREALPRARQGQTEESLAALPLFQILA